MGVIATHWLVAVVLPVVATRRENTCVSVTLYNLAAFLLACAPLTLLPWTASSPATAVAVVCGLLASFLFFVAAIAAYLARGHLRRDVAPMPPPLRRQEGRRQLPPPSAGPRTMRRGREEFDGAGVGSAGAAAESVPIAVEIVMAAACDPPQVEAVVFLVAVDQQ